MILFICETKAQVLNAMSLRYFMLNNEIVDICLCNKTGLLSDIKIQIEKKKLFNRIYELKTTYRPKQDWFSMIKKIFNGFGLIRRLQKHLPDLSTNYSNIFISGPDLDCIGIYYLLRRQNKNIKLCLYEEGIFEYYIFKYKLNKFYRIYSKIVYGLYYLDECNEIYVYNSKAIIGKPNNVKAINIPLINQCKAFKQIANDVFNYNPNELDLLQSCKYLFVDSCFSDVTSANIQAAIVEHLSTQLGNQLIVKLHPRSPLDKYDKCGVKCLKTKQSFEIIMLNNQLENITFLTMYSSAIFNMKFMFNLTPKTILLNQIYNISTKNTGIDYLIEKFREDFPNDKLYQPNNLEELINILRKIET